MGTSDADVGPGGGDRRLGGLVVDGQSGDVAAL